ncbi:hypothetical protein R0381_002069 [Jeongeupia wiesaeckerbachi]|uniref:hypothetical protein n=1 Tax=Jeongeupia wiesaeckerbachi TaxID=3051218 RepID=UPI003D800E70
MRACRLCLVVSFLFSPAAFALKEGDAIYLKLGWPSPSSPTTDAIGFDYAAPVSGACNNIQRSSYAAYLLRTNVVGAKVVLESCSDNNGSLRCKLKIATGSYANYYVGTTGDYPYSRNYSTSAEPITFVRRGNYDFSSQNLGVNKGDVYALQGSNGNYLRLAEEYSGCGVNYLRFNEPDISKSSNFAISTP